MSRRALPTPALVAARSAERRVLLLLALAGAALLAATGWFEWQARRAALEQAELVTRNSVGALVEYVNGAFRQADALAGVVVSSLDHGLGDAALRELIFRQLHEQPALGELYVYDAQGRLVASSWAGHRHEASARGRPFFELHRASARDGLAVGAPYRIEPHGQWVIPLSRRLDDARGEFRGVVVAALSVERLVARFGELELGPDALVALNTGEGVVLARRPHVESALGMELANTPLHQEHFALAGAGTFSALSPVDGLERQYSFAHSAAYPVLVMVAMSTDHALAAWRRSAVVVALCVAALLALIAWGGGRLHRTLSAQHALAEQLAASHRRLADLERAIDQHALVSITDVQGTIVHANERFCALSGYSAAELIGANHRIIRSEHHDAAFFRHLWRTIAQGGVWQGEVCNRARDGSPYWVHATVVPFLDERGKPLQYISIRTDISERKRAEEQLRTAYEHLGDVNRELARLASFDPLTGLPNRRAFDAALDDEFRRAHRSGLPLAVLMIDVDHFKLYNDRYGHPAGDAALQRVALAARCVQRRPGDLAARWGGEEFAMLLPATDAHGALAVAARLCQAVLALDIEHAASAHGRVTVSVGVHALQPAAGGTPADLMAAADRALYQAKQAGRHCARLLGPERVGSDMGQVA